MGERLKPPVLKTGVHFVDRGFESRPLRQKTQYIAAIAIGAIEPLPLATHMSLDWP